MIKNETDYKYLYEEMSKRLSSISKTCAFRLNKTEQFFCRDSEETKDVLKSILKQTKGNNLIKPYE